MLNKLYWIEYERVYVVFFPVRPIRFVETGLGFNPKMV